MGTSSPSEDARSLQHEAPNPSYFSIPLLTSGTLYLVPNDGVVLGLHGTKDAVRLGVSWHKCGTPRPPTNAKPQMIVAWRNGSTADLLSLSLSLCMDDTYFLYTLDYTLCYIYIYVYTWSHHTTTYIHKHIYSHTLPIMYVYIYVYVYIYICIYIYSAYIYIYTCISIYIYIYICLGASSYRLLSSLLSSQMAGFRGFRV